MGFEGQAQPPLLRRVIGSVLRRIRQRQGRTLRDVAGAADMSVPYLSELERGRKEPSSEVLAAICRALGLHLVDLLDEVREEVARLQPAVPARVPMRRAPRFAAGRPGTAIRLAPPASVPPAGSRPGVSRPPGAQCRTGLRSAVRRRRVGLAFRGTRAPDRLLTANFRTA
ncbi:helix-turn-helix domain-containing protein [Micromonospora zhanjiangensis]|uniref:Helix-turn-helix domain-containing protein n=1 Tax=Micromonospora zhanjiangensis TaxID=1522057 RepID=A0ABV8KV49_9ACTN